MSRKILAMDLSLNCPSFAVLETVGDRVKILEVTHVYNKNNKKPTGQKLNEIADALSNIILDHKLNEGDTHVVREKGFSRFALTTQQLFRVVGVSDLMVYALLNKGDIEEITPTSVKKLVTGDGKASKEDVEDGVRGHLIPEQRDYIFKTDDESDAVAVGISYIIKKGLFYK